ncbi:hypothetical protein C6361_28440 [Plantactinospora sp. BC1]|uniref:hypothetical protein n=1 Tax=Plantactinospora sp. BC1 TaxID=2108470 RepID=UPI000D17C635|nr:hypothetical protein [Plantactinospora sp. BC1]AVT32741.1 hypothetical protein C6361_28440 [Plantactinospora sp. BC1]
MSSFVPQTADHRDDRVPTRWTRPVQNLTLVCSLLFVAGTALQNFVVIDLRAMEEMMRLAGATQAQAQADAPGFLTGFRIVGCVYLVGNAVGLLARTGRTWVFWTALAVNVTQAAGLVMIPPEVFEATRDRFGVPGLLPSYVTDGGAALLAVVLLAVLLRYRRPWAYRRIPAP